MNQTCLIYQNGNQYNYLLVGGKNKKANELIQQMNIRDLIITSAENINSVHIFNLRQPFYQDAKDLLQIFNVYKICLQRKGHKTISFTEQNTPNFKYQNNFMLKFLQELFFPIQEVDIKFVCLDQLTFKYFSYELMKQQDELKIPYLNCDINNSKFFLYKIDYNMHLENGEDTKQEVYLLNTGITTEIESVEEQQ